MTTTPEDSTQVRTSYIKASDGTTLILKYRHADAQALRASLQRIRLKGDKQPSLALIARRSMALYLAHLESSPTAFANEVQALEKLATPVSHRKQKPISEAARAIALGELIGLGPGSDAGRSL